MRRAYNILLVCLLPFILLRLYIKSRKLVGYRQGLKQRLAIKLPTNKTIDVWLHAVSFGEVNAAAPLVKKLLDDKCKVLFTTMTPTGSKQVLNLFGENVYHSYIPYDIEYFVIKFFRAFKPKMLLIMETELWPNLIHAAYKRNIPVLILNGRISDKAFPQYQRLKCFFKPTLQKITRILAQSPLDAARFRELGANDKQVVVSGNLKFDMHLSKSDKDVFQDLKQQWGVDRPVFLAASTHHDEEQQILNQLTMLKKTIPNLLLVIAPRHPERFDDVYQLSQIMGFITACKSRVETIKIQSDVVILDTMGELKHFYGIADFAFVGGSLVPVGGHNVLEPMLHMVPVITGAYHQNSKSIISSLVQRDAIKIGHDITGVVQALVDLAKHPKIAEDQARRAALVLKENEGSLENHLSQILPFLEDGKSHSN